ncbi:MAG: hypothetical protein RLZZ590_63 [Actinomycetota bacterium]|jgi:aminodeoxychorismate synthase component I
MRLFSARLDAWVSAPDIFTLLHSKDEHAFWLDREHHPTQRYSVIGASSGTSDLENLGQVRQILVPVENQLDLPFAWRPGVAGVLSYEGKPHFLAVDRAIVLDHDLQHLYFVGLFESQEQFRHWHQAALLRLGLSGGQVASYRQLNGQGSVDEVSLRHDSVAYLAMIERAVEHIAAGDVYQLCLTNQISMRHNLDPLNIFLKLREQNPAPYASYFRFADLSLVSSSPEQFISVNSKGALSTRPIKGTRPRADNPTKDSEIAAELEANEKERAENLMIVDLMRNDFGRVARPGSIGVPELFQVETYATVHQLVSTVTAQLAEGNDAADALKACFPGGSMTGAPKIRAMELINELEVGERGLYSGVAGFIGVDGSAEFGMIIRSIVFEGENATIGVGGGITFDSDPVAELEETKLKASALLKVLNAPDPWA